ncbi:MAG TPA: hypothetical protein VF263_06130 [Longimicrobiaceae bacterium]
MSRKVWCVFQRLPGESCPALSAVCATRAAADELVRISAGDEEEQGRPRSAWTVSAWGVLDGDVAGIADAQQLSDVLDPMRAGAIPLDEAQEEDAPATGAGGPGG